jgi:hypothetical protein
MTGNLVTNNRAHALRERGKRFLKTITSVLEQAIQINRAGSSMPEQVSREEN